MINTILFDFDGTLFHTLVGVHKAANELLRRHKLEPLPLEVVKHFIGGGSENLIEQIDEATHHCLGHIRASMDEFHEIYDGLIIEESVLYDGVVDFLSSWSGNLAIVSNKHEKYVRKLVDNSDLKQFPWQSIVGGDSLDEKKPSPKPLFKALDDLDSQASEAVLVGDGRPDIEAARAARIPIVGVTYGYSSLEFLKNQGVERLIDHISELPAQLESL